MRVIVAVGMAVVLAGCAGGNQSHSELSDEARKKALDELLADSDQEPRPEPAHVAGSSSSDYKIDPDVLAKNYAEIQRRASAGTTSTARQPVKEKPAASKWGEGWEQYGDWYVKALHDDMDTVTHVRMFTAFNYTPSTPGTRLPWQDDFNLGFEIFGGSVVTLSPSAGFLGKGYWPHCDYDLSSASVNGAKAVRLTPVDMPGSCNAVDRNGEAIQQFKVGSQARIRMGYMDGKISLAGFSAAWARAMQLSK